MSVNSGTQRVLGKALADDALSRDDAMRLMAVDVNSDDCYALMSAANRLTHRICAEVGMNPRDRAVDTSKCRGMSVESCERMLWEAGFTHERRVAPILRATS